MIEDVTDSLNVSLDSQLNLKNDYQVNRSKSKKKKSLKKHKNKAISYPRKQGLTIEILSQNSKNEFNMENENQIDPLFDDAPREPI